jgi:hypothetical protein
MKQREKATKRKPFASERKFKKQLYYRACGEHLPEDFFRDEE